MKLEKRFRLSYAGEVEYYVGRDLFSARYFGNPDMPWNGDYFETGIKPSIGCVRYADSSRWHEFPPPEVMELFSGFVAQRLIIHPSAVPGELGTAEYICNGPAPELVPHPLVPNYITSRALVELERSAEE